MLAHSHLWAARLTPAARAAGAPWRSPSCVRRLGVLRGRPLPPPSGPSSSGSHNRAGSFSQKTEGGASFLLPTLKVPMKGELYAAAGDLAGNLIRVPEVQVEASGSPAAGLRVLRLCSLAHLELQKTTGFLPGFGHLALRLKRYEQPLRAPQQYTLWATVARVVDVPLPSLEDSTSPPLVVRRDSDAGKLAVLLVDRLRQSSEVVIFRCVGEAAAGHVLWAVSVAEKQLASTLAVAPRFGNSLSAWSLDRQEVILAIARWTQPAPLLPAPLRWKNSRPPPLAP